MPQIDSALPGSDLVQAGIRDLAAGQVSAEAFLVSVGCRRLRGLGIDVPDTTNTEQDAELSLYWLLLTEFPTEAYTRYNALLRRLVSFEQALERQVYSRSGATANGFT